MVSALLWTSAALMHTYIHALTTINHEWKDIASVEDKMACCRTYVWLHACTSLPLHVGKGIFMSFLFFFCNNLPKKQELETSFKEFCFVSSINPIGGCDLNNTFLHFWCWGTFVQLYTVTCQKNTNKKNSIWQCDDAITDNHIVCVRPAQIELQHLHSCCLLVSAVSFLHLSCAFQKGSQRELQEGQPTVNCSCFPRAFDEWDSFWGAGWPPTWCFSWKRFL